ncbi:MAG: hypothetical protein IMZ62_08070 [Chloroflexi bacterium]|nr:hypothetical protein [Chloroflexota bacterium]MBE3118779.1 hypothetical protein [Candidatus Atribacteria bacterium]
MAQLLYIDNETAWTGAADPTPAWDSLVDAGASSIARDTAGGNDGYGLVCTVVSAAQAYLSKGLGSAQAAVGVGFWLRVSTGATWSDGNVVRLANLSNADYESLRIWLVNALGSTRLRLYLFGGGGDYGYVFSTTNLVLGAWYWVSADATWDGSAATATLYLNGASQGSATVASNSLTRKPDKIWLGPHTSTAGVSIVYHLDDLRVTDGELPPAILPALSRECMERREQRRLRQELNRTLHHRTYQLPAGKTLAAVDLEIGDVIPHEPLMEIVDSEMIEERVLDPRTGRIRIMPSRRVRCVGEEVAAWAD